MLLAVLAALLWDVIVDGLVLFGFGFRLDHGGSMYDGADRQLDGDRGVLVAGIETALGGCLVVLVVIVGGGRVRRWWRGAGRIRFRGRISLDHGTAIDCGRSGGEERWG